MDMLGKPKLRKTILEYYETLDEPSHVRMAIEEGICKEESTRGLLRMALFGAKNVKILLISIDNSHVFNFSLP